MRTRIQRSTAATAALLVLNTAFYSEEKSRDFSRCRFSRESLRRTAGWYRLSHQFIDGLAEELYGLGWKLIDLNDTEFAMMQIAKIDVWPKIGNKRLGDAGLLGASEEEIFRLYDARFPESSGDEASDE